MSTSSRYHHGALRQALLHTTAELLETRPAGQISLREVARVAGVSSAAPYRHFSDRTDLLIETAALHAAAFVDAQAQAVEEHDDPAERLVALGEAYVMWATDHPHAFGLLFDPEVSPAGAPPPPLAPHLERHRALLERCVDDARAAGVLPAGPDRDLVAAALWSAAHGLAALQRGGHFARGDSRAILAALLATIE